MDERSVDEGGCFMLDGCEGGPGLESHLLTPQVLTRERLARVHGFGNGGYSNNWLVELNVT